MPQLLFIILGICKGDYFSAELRKPVWLFVPPLSRTLERWTLSFC